MLRRARNVEVFVLTYGGRSPDSAGEVFKRQILDQFVGIDWFVALQITLAVKADTDVDQTVTLLHATISELEAMLDRKIKSKVVEIDGWRGIQPVMLTVPRQNLHSQASAFYNNGEHRIPHAVDVCAQTVVQKRRPYSAKRTELLYSTKGAPMVDRESLRFNSRWESESKFA
jgi:hypothetical protein